MAIKPFERLLNAREILDKCSGCEATFRSAVHQSYYAAYNQLANEVDNRLFYPVDQLVRRSSVHKAYLDSCINKLDSLNKDHINYSSLDRLIKDFKRLRAIRRVSDYELIKTVYKEEAQLALELSDRFFNLLDDLE